MTKTRFRLLIAELEEGVERLGTTLSQEAATLAETESRIRRAVSEYMACQAVLDALQQDLDAAAGEELLQEIQPRPQRRPR